MNTQAAPVCTHLANLPSWAAEKYMPNDRTQRYCLDNRSQVSWMSSESFIRHDGEQPCAPLW